MSYSASSRVASTARSSGNRTACELADIVRQYGQAFRETHRLRASQRKALWCIEHCRTSALGGHRYYCRDCPYERYVYHSCRNRHCPKCQSLTTAAWVAARQREILPVPYFHNVFTLPHELNALILYSEVNQQALLDLLFASAADTLLEFGEHELGGKVGFTLVLHSWDQRLRPHFHLHCLIASGALSADGTRWVPGGAQFLFPVRALSKVYRAKYLEALEDLLAHDLLDLPPQLAFLADGALRRSWLRRLWRKSWNVYSKPPFAGPQKLISYLGRYTHKVAISNHRLLRCDAEQVTFSYRDRADGDRVKRETLPAGEFLERFVKHILPDHFSRIRHYGLLSNRDKHARLAHCRKLLGCSAMEKRLRQSQQWAESMRQLTGLDVQRCPCCHEPLSRQTLSAIRPDMDASYSPPPHPEFEEWNTS
jgi:hypothetical protein